MAYTDMERRILDMWPRFEDGRYVQIGDAYIDTGGDDEEVVEVRFRKGHADLVGLEGFYTRLKPSERVKRPAPKVLDADGVPIEVGDVVYDVGDPMPAEVVEMDGDVVHVQYADGLIFERKAHLLTHEKPDSWKQLEKDATMSPWLYCDKHVLMVDKFDGEYIPTIETFSRDLIRRAKALAEKEAGR